MAKRKLTEEELQALRHLAMRVGLGTPVCKELEPATAKFLSNRGLVRLIKGEIFSKYEITHEGLSEIAASGRTTLYDPRDLFFRYKSIFDTVKPLLDRMSLRVMGLMEYVDPAYPHRNLENILFLRKDEGLWRREHFGDADMLLGKLSNWLSNTIEGNLETAAYDEKNLMSKAEWLKKKP